MIIELNYTDKNLMPNKKNGRHWAETLNAKKASSYEAFICTKLKIQSTKPVIEKNKSIALTINYVQKDNRHRDLDNLLAASKASIDGIAQALGIDDKLFEPITILRSKDTAAKMIINLDLT